MDMVTRKPCLDRQASSIHVRLSAIRVQVTSCEGFVDCLLAAQSTRRGLDISGLGRLNCTLIARSLRGTASSGCRYVSERCPIME